MLTNLRELWRLSSEEEESQTYQEIQEGLVFKGHNLWLLAAAMVIACIGLNADNAAAVIGAMLISPLMGPVIGFGFGVSIQSPSMMRLSVRNWLVMVGTSLLASTLFFLITPFHYSTSQLQGYTEGTIFDVMLAFVGGIAGFVGIIRKEAIKVIAGVAVATACIPPLCTAGYGLANWQWTYALGGFYFFIINCFFIGLGTWATSMVLGFRKHYVIKTQRKGTWSVPVGLVGLLLLAPSIWTAFHKWQKQHFERRVAVYVERIQLKYPDWVVVHHKAKLSKGHQSVDISLLNDRSEITDEELDAANQLDPSIDVLWHFAPDKASREAARLRRDLQRLDSLVQKQQRQIQQLQRLQQP